MVKQLESFAGPVWVAIVEVVTGKVRRTDFSIDIEGKPCQVSVYRITERLIRMDVKPEVK